MRLVTGIGVAVLVFGLSTLSAQEPDALSRLLPENAPPINLEFRDAEVEAVLDVLATIGMFEIYFSHEVGEELGPISLSFANADYEVVLRAVLNLPGLRYTVVGDDTLLVSRT